MSTILLHPLSSPDGSATYSPPSSSPSPQPPSVTLLSGINYPLELPQRSRELPTSTFIDVTLRPSNAVAQVKERHIESLVKKVLSSIVLGAETPRCMLQCTLQIVQQAQDETLPGGVKCGGQGESYLPVLASAINCAVLGCMDGAVQMRGPAGACLVAVGRTGDVCVWPGIKERKGARSLHVFCFGRTEESLLWESEGKFGVGEWEGAERVARRAVLGDARGEDVEMDEGEGICLFDEMRRAVEVRVAKDGRWKGE